MAVFVAALSSCPKLFLAIRGGSDVLHLKLLIGKSSDSNDVPLQFESVPRCLFFCSCRLGGSQTDASNSGVDLVYRVRRSLAQNRRRASPTQSPKSCKASRVVRNYSGPRQDLYSKRLIVMHASRLGQGKHGPSSIFCRRGEVTVTDWS